MDIKGDILPTKAAASFGSADWKTPSSMLLVQLIVTASILLSKVSINGGMFIFALLTYRSFVGAVFILPFALIFQREKWREAGWHAMGWIFLNASIGYAVPMSLYSYGLLDTAPAYSTIFLNIVPLVTFILSIFLRLETLRIGTVAGLLKIGSVLLSVAGAMVIILNKGKRLHIWDPILEQHKEQHTADIAGNQLRGTIYLVGSTFAYACWFLLQAKVHKVFPYIYWSSMATCLIGGFQTALLGILLRRDINAWKLGWDLDLVNVLFSGALGTAGRYSLNSWAVSRRGPAYPPMFSPLLPVFTMLLDSIFIGHDIKAGSLIGTITVVVGLFIFLWAKSKEVRDEEIIKEAAIS
ncbi:WAT1-related protein At1g25270-like [Lolium rigidum]|uniref:WAT1-related protein At1g25270-like n=1 Tax=Lolium rigidum TaxID=89674 RepID=UPI001F5E08A3|nr:WAT1-related protein At1g25270-like [Lolium rigidum]